MSKTTKALAILGVVAGLGVAALPFNAMAVTELKNTGPADPVTDQVTVKTTIQDYIAIELKGVENEGTFDETAPTDKTVTEGEGDDEIQKVVAHTHVLDLGNLINNAENPLEGSLLVNVKTNNVKGYKLGIKAESENMVGIVPTNTIATGIPTQGTSAWGFKVANADASNSDLTIADDYKDGAYKAVPTSNTNIANSSKATDLDGTETKVTFGVTASASQAADTYSAVVTFTAATEATAASN